MATIRHTQITSTSKKRKGQWYPKFYIKSPNWTKPLRPSHSDILFYKRADTQEKKRQNANSQRLLDALYREYEKKYEGTEYTLAPNEAKSLINHIDDMIGLKADKSESTVKGYKNLRSAILRFCEDKQHSPKMNINKVDIRFLDEFRVWLVNDAGLSGGSPYKYFGLLSTSFKKAKQYGLLYNNPFDNDVEFPKKEKSEMVFLTPEEVLKMKHTSFDTPVRDAFLFMCYTGIRQGDCRSLTWGDLPVIDGDTKINVRTQKAKTDIFFKIRKSAMEFLPAKRMGDSDKVFPNLKFDNPNNQKLRAWAYRSGVKKHITPHTARHSFAFFMLDRHNTPLYTLSKILGHTNARTTEDEYGHLSVENIEEAMEKAFGE